VTELAPIGHLAARLGVKRGAIEDHGGGALEGVMGEDLAGELVEKRVGVVEALGSGHGGRREA
jgi:hypothetical protein